MKIQFVEVKFFVKNFIQITISCGKGYDVNDGVS